jgi:hypothetical protein
MAKIVQVITRASEQYDAAVAHSLIRDLDGVIEKLNTTYQEEIKQEIEAYKLMAVVNEFKFYGVDNDTTGNALTMFGTSGSVQNPQASETYIVKSIKVTSASTPTVTVLNNAITAIKSAALTANETRELLTMPMVVEGGTTLTVQSSNTGSFDVAISYLNIKKEVVA